MSIAVSAIICIAWTLISPEKDKTAWARFKGIEVEDGEQVTDYYRDDPTAMDRALKVCCC